MKMGHDCQCDYNPTESKGRVFKQLFVTVQPSTMNKCHTVYKHYQVSFYLHIYRLSH